MVKLLKSVWHGEEGASMIEYGLLVALIAVVCISTITLIGTSMNAKFTEVKTSVGGGS